MNTLRTLAISNHMTVHGERMEQILVAAKILRSLTGKFNYVVCFIEESNYITTLSIDESQRNFCVQERHMKSQCQQADTKYALKISNDCRMLHMS